MGVSSCTGPNCERGVQVCNAGWGLEMLGAPCEKEFASQCLHRSTGTGKIKILSLGTVFIVTPETGDEQ